MEDLLTHAYFLPTITVVNRALAATRGADMDRLATAHRRPAQCCYAALLRFVQWSAGPFYRAILPSPHQLPSSRESGRFRRH